MQRIAQRTCRSKGLNPAILETTNPPLLQQHKGLSLCAAFYGQVWDAWIQLLCCFSCAAGSSKGRPRTQARYESGQWLDSTRLEVSEVCGSAKVFYHTQCFICSQNSPVYRYIFIQTVYPCASRHSLWVILPRLRLRRAETGAKADTERWPRENGQKKPCIRRIQYRLCFQQCRLVLTVLLCSKTCESPPSLPSGPLPLAHSAPKKAPVVKRS